MPRGEAKAGDRRSDRGRRRGAVRRRAEPELGPMPATLAALPLPSLPTGGGWRRTGDPSAASLPWTRGGPQKGKDRSDQAWAAPAAPVRPITNQRPKPIRGPRRSKAARAGVRLANRPPPGGWLARGPRARVRRWRLLTRVLGGPSDAGRTAVAPREVRVRRKGNYCVDVRIASQSQRRRAPGTGRRRQTARQPHVLQKRPPSFLDSNFHRPYLGVFLSISEGWHRGSRPGSLLFPGGLSARRTGILNPVCSHRFFRKGAFLDR